MTRIKNITVLTVVFVITLAACSPTGPAEGRLLEKESEHSYNYLLYLPMGHNKDKQKKWPVIVFLHGTSMRGDNLEKLKLYGLPSLLENRKDFPFIVIAPQCPKDKMWASEEWLMPLLKETGAAYRMDEERIYLTGISLGGEGTWYLAVKHPDVFAAAAPCSGPTLKLGLPLKAKKIKHLPVWVFHGARDTNILPEEPQEMVEALKKHGGNVKFTLFPAKGHGGFTSVYEDPELFTWFLEQKKNNTYANNQKRVEGAKTAGKKNGKWIYWHKNGKKEKEVFYKGGLAHGPWVSWDSSGRKQGEGHFENGTGKWTEFYENGVIEREETYKKSKRDGKWVYRYENGKTRHISGYKEGGLHGVWRGWARSGSERYHIYYKEGKENGEWKFWFKNGVLRRLWHFKDGYPHGKIVNRFENGQKQVEGIMRKGKPYGLWKWWNKEGKLQRSKDHKE